MLNPIVFPIYGPFGVNNLATMTIPAGPGINGKTRQNPTGTFGLQGDTVGRKRIQGQHKRRPGRKPTIGHRYLIRRGTVPNSRRHLGTEMAAVRAGLTDNAIRNGKVTMAKQILINDAVTKYGILQLALMWTRDKGYLATNPAEFLTSNLADKIMAWQKSLERTLETLGIEPRESDAIITVEDLHRLGEIESGSGSGEPDPFDESGTDAAGDAAENGDGMRSKPVFNGNAPRGGGSETKGPQIENGDEIPNGGGE
jgi:hypothetical protein